MTARWRVLLRLMLALFLIVTASPLATLAESATPVPVVESPGQPAAPEPADDPQPAPPVPPDNIGASSPEPSGLAPAAASSLEAPSVTSVYVSKTYCQDDARQGTTDFVLYGDSITTLAGSSCNIVPPPDPSLYPVTVTLTNVEDASLTFSDTLQAWPLGGFDHRFENIPAGTYTLSQSGPDIPNVTSQPMTFSGSYASIGIIDYIAETDLPQPDPSGENASIDGSIFFCTAPDRAAGDVEFRIDNSSLHSFLNPDSLAETIHCDDVREDFSFAGQLGTYPYDPETGTIDDRYLNPALPGGFQEFHIPALEAGEYYVLAWIDPLTGNATLSAPFAVQESDWFPKTIVDVLLFSDPVPTGVVNLTVEVCVDAARAGDTTFTVIGESIMSASSATICRELGYGVEDDAPMTLTLTNIDTGRTWHQSGTSIWDFGSFSGVPTGTYTIGRTDGDDPITSSPFTVDSVNGTTIQVRTYIAEGDWTWPPSDDPIDTVTVDAYICLNPGLETSGAFSFSFIPNQDLPGGAPVADLTLCHPATPADGVGFTLIQGDTTVPLEPGWDETYWEVRLRGSDLDGAEGQFELVETSTGTSSGAVLMAGSVNAHFFLYRNATASISVTSSHSLAPDTVPGDATWSISREGSVIESGTFAPDHLDLPATIDVATALHAGEYLVEVDAWPAFAPYAEPFTVETLAPTIPVDLAPLTGTLSIYKDFCVDPSRAGTTAFSVSHQEPESTPRLAAQGSECRNRLPDDGQFDYILTGIATGQTWVGTLHDWAGLDFDQIPTGTYILTEIGNGGSVISDPFDYDAEWNWAWVTSRTFLAEADWTPGDSDFTRLTVWGYICASPDRSGDAEFFTYGFPGEMVPQTRPAALTTAAAECREARDTDGLTFQLIPQDGGTPIPFERQGYGGYEPVADVEPGEYELVELTTGATTGVLHFSGMQDVEFQRYEGELESTVTVTMRSLNPTIANTLPADATWTVSRDGTVLVTDTFASGHLSLPATIEIHDRVPFGRYDITIDAGPAFEPYEASWEVNRLVQSFTIDLVPLRPVTTATFTVASGDPSLANTVPAGATWTITSEDGDFEISGSWEETTTLPATVDTGDTLFFGMFTLRIDAGEAFEPFSEPFQVLLGTHDLGTFTLNPVVDVEETVLVDLELDSADHAVAARMPSGSTWTLTSTETPDLVFSGTIPEDQLGLPATLSLPDPIPAGEYMLEIDATPTFQLWRGPVTLANDADEPLTLRRFLAQQETRLSVAVLLQPVPVDPEPTATVTPTPTAPVTPEPTSTTPVTPEPTATTPATPEPTSTTPVTPEPTLTAPATPAPTNETETGVTPTAPATPAAGVTGLPTTGQGLTAHPAAGALLLTALAAVLAALGGITIRRGRV